MKKLLMSSIIITVFASSLVLFQLSSCTKANANSCPPAVYPVSGLWEGTYLTNEVSHAPTYYSFTVYPDGSLLIKAKGVPPAQDIIYGEGTWSLNAKIFTFTYTTINYPTAITQTGQLTFSNTGSMTGGTWTDVNVTSNAHSGTFPVMNRIN